MVAKGSAADRMRRSPLDAGGCHLQQKVCRQNHERGREITAVREVSCGILVDFIAICCGVSVDLEAFVVAIRYHTRSNQQEKLQGFRAGQDRFRWL